MGKLEDLPAVYDAQPFRANRRRHVTAGTCGACRATDRSRMAEAAARVRWHATRAGSNWRDACYPLRPRDYNHSAEHTIDGNTKHCTHHETDQREPDANPEREPDRWIDVLPKE